MVQLPTWCCCVSNREYWHQKSKLYPCSFFGVAHPESSFFSIAEPLFWRENWSIFKSNMDALAVLSNLCDTETNSFSTSLGRRGLNGRHDSLVCDFKVVHPGSKRGQLLAWSSPQSKATPLSFSKWKNQSFSPTLPGQSAFLTTTNPSSKPIHQIFASPWDGL